MTVQFRNLDLRVPDYWPPHPMIWQRHRSAVFGIGPLRLGASISYFGASSWTQIGPFNVSLKFDRQTVPA